MTLVLGAAVLAGLWWRDAPAAALLLAAAGWLLHLGTAFRLVRATLGGAGGHAEWVRETSVRPRIARSPAWVWGWLLLGAGALVAALG